MAISKVSKDRAIRSRILHQHFADCDVCETREGSAPSLCMSGNIMLTHFIDAIRAEERARRAVCEKHEWSVDEQGTRRCIGCGVASW